MTIAVVVLDVLLLTAGIAIAALIGDVGEGIGEHRDAAHEIDQRSNKLRAAVDQWQEAPRG